MKKRYLKLLIAVVTAMFMLSSLCVYAESAADIKTIVGDKASWKAADGVTVETNGGKLTVNASGTAGDTARKFKDEVFKMTVFIPESAKAADGTTIQATEGKAWPGFMLRSGNPTFWFWGDDNGENTNDCYLFVIRPSGVELQKWVAGEQEYIREIKKSNFKHGKDNVVEIAAIDTAEGVKTYIKENDVVIAEYVDTGTPLPEGYFGIAAANLPVTISPVAAKAPATEKAPAAGNASADAGSSSNPTTGDPGIALYIAAAGIVLLGMMFFGKRIKMSMK